MKRLKIITIFLTLLAALVLCLPAQAQGNDPSSQGPLVLTDKQGQYPLGRQMDILEDPSSELTIEEVA